MSGSASSTTQPRRWKVSRSASITAVTRGSTGRPPRSRLQAMRAPSGFRSSGGWKSRPGSGSEIGARGSGPATAPSIRATSVTLRAIGPCTPIGNQAAWLGQIGTRPGAGRKPTTLQKPAGLRSDPPRSLPSAIGSIPEASAAAAPPLLPPHVFVRSYGLRVAPNTALNVCDPAPSSGVLVLPMVMAPAARSRSTMSASASGTKCSNARHPKVVRMPFVHVRSLWATGSPCSGPSSSPRATAASAASAPRRASSGSSVTIALTVGLTCSMRSR